jgi:precorrin-2 dehydrogenase
MGYMVNLTMEGKAAAVIGGGEVAARKVEDLLAAKARVTVIAPSACARIVALAEEKRIEAHWRPYRTEDLENVFVAIAATDDELVNAGIARDARERKVLVNVVDRPALCTFTMPATVRRGDLTLAVATEGRAPALASLLREELEGRYGAEYAGLADMFGDLRSEMIVLGWEGAAIREALAGLYRDGVTKLIADGDPGRLREFLRARLGPEFPLP